MSTKTKACNFCGESVTVIEGFGICGSCSKPYRDRGEEGKTKVEKQSLYQGSNIDYRAVAYETPFGALNGCQMEEIRKDRMWTVLDMFGDSQYNLTPQIIGITVMDVKNMILLLEDSKVRHGAQSDAKKLEGKRFVDDANRAIGELILALQRIDNVIRSGAETGSGNDGVDTDGVKNEAVEMKEFFSAGKLGT